MARAAHRRWFCRPPFDAMPLPRGLPGRSVAAGRKGRGVAAPGRRRRRLGSSGKCPLFSWPPSSPLSTLPRLGAAPRARTTLVCWRQWPLLGCSRRPPLCLSRLSFSFFGTFSSTGSLALRQCRLAHCCLRGVGLPRSEAEAVLWFHRAAAAHFPDAHYNLVPAPLPPGLTRTQGPRRASRPTDLTSRPTDLTSRPTDLTSRPTDLTSRQTDLTSRPRDLTSRPTDLTRGPRAAPFLEPNAWQPWHPQPPRVRNASEARAFSTWPYTPQPRCRAVPPPLHATVRCSFYPLLIFSLFLSLSLLALSVAWVWSWSWSWWWWWWWWLVPARGVGAQGVCYHLGRGGPQNLPLAMRHYRAAADRGSAEAMSNLGSMHAAGQVREKHLTAPRPRFSSFAFLRGPTHLLFLVFLTFITS